MVETFFLSFVPVLLLHLFMACLAVAETNITTDQSALLALKAQITDDPHNILANNWSTTTSVCNWIGVTCGVRHRRVTALNLSYMGLTGTIPLQVGNLSFLALLSIRNNSFYGSPPDELARLHRLKSMDIGFNFFSGNISSWICSLPKLKNLVLKGNYFIGTVPALSCNMSSLQKIDLSHNKFSSFMPFNIFNGSMLRIIDLSFNHISSTLPVDFFHHLPNLEELYLSENQLYGQIPSSLFKCRDLQVLSLSSNNFTGSIPAEIGNSTKIKRLYLGDNNLEGKIPREMGYLINMENLSISNNHLTGSIWSSIGNCTLLKEINFGENNLTGTIPDEIGKLRHLEVLRIYSNILNGHIPSIIFNISTMKSIALYANHLSGRLPSSIGLGLPNLMELLLWGNKLEGIIPSSISNASQLTSLDLSSNLFSGFIPNTLGNLRHLQVLSLAYNNLTSEYSTPELNFLSSLTNCKHLRRLVLSGNPLNAVVPISIGNLSPSLQYFLANECNHKGNIPEEIGNLIGLIDLRLGNNEFSGTIPTTLGRLRKLQGLYLQGNRLQGTIPYDLCHLENLVILSLGGNKLSGSIPVCLGNLTSLRDLNLSYNELTSAIPLTLWSLENILNISMSSNSLSGSLPLDIINLKVVIEIDLSRNQLSGNIPDNIGRLENLASLSLAKNGLQGPIPQSFNNTLSLEFLDLSRNNLSGVIPKSLERLSYLKYFNVSFNRLEGEIPKGGPFAFFSSQSFMNNTLCGATQLQVPPCKTDITLRKSRTRLILQLKSFLLITSATIQVLSLVYVALRCQKRKMVEPLETFWRRISYQELLLATDGFSEGNLLGIGSFGSVYKGTLEDGFEVAIKVFNIELERQFGSFNVECEIIRTTLHRNIVRVYNSCSMDMDFKALILEYMPNGSLDKWLQTHNYHLDVPQRIDIMIDVASAVEYLHYDSSRPIVHCDLKPRNILLDEDMVAHVSDFSIAQILPEIDSAIQIMTLATVGYMAPEYGSNGIVSTKTDVYSFGIMLMEMFTAKRPTDEMFAGEMSLKRWVYESLPHKVDRIADSTLLQTEEEHFAAKKVCISSLMGVALFCLAESPTERINIKDAHFALKDIKIKFLNDIVGD